MRPTWADVDLGAIGHNVSVLCGAVAPAQVCAVVKADGYGHGAVPVARAALDAGATWLAVALVDEGRVLRDAGIAAPILVLSEPRPFEMIEVVLYDLRPVYSGEGLAAAAAAANQTGRPIKVHLKIDTGMNRVGASPEDAVPLARAIVDKPLVDLEGVWTHMAMADEPDDPCTDRQLDTFERVLVDLGAAGLTPPLRHAANSAAAIAYPRSRLDMVRCGIAVYYGVPPGPALAGLLPLRPAMTIRSQVSFIKQVRAGDKVSYGRRWQAPTDRWIATVPIGYADGIRRRLWKVGGEVLIGGRRRAIAGTITMDQLMVDCGSETDVRPGDEVVLIGAQGDEEISAAEVAAKLDTIGYEVVCDIESRIPRRYR